MRLSEKTFELTFCSQFAEKLRLGNIIWFGLTQKQEQKFGFDLCTRLNGNLFILQFKASNNLVKKNKYKKFKKPRRRFSMPHEQLERLQQVASVFPDCVYYALPNLGNTEELSKNLDVVDQTWFLNVSDIPNPFQIPTNKAKCHYAYMDPPEIELWSEPHITEVIKSKDIIQSFENNPPNSKKIVEWCKETNFKFKGLRAYGLLWNSNPIP